MAVSVGPAVTSGAQPCACQVARAKSGCAITRGAAIAERATVALPSASLPGKASVVASYAGAATSRNLDNSFQTGFRLAW